MSFTLMSAYNLLLLLLAAGLQLSPFCCLAEDEAGDELVEFVVATGWKRVNLITSRNTSDPRWEHELLKRLQKETGIYGRFLHYEDMRIEHVTGTYECT